MCHYAFYLYISALNQTLLLYKTHKIIKKVTYKALVVRQHDNNLSIMVPNHSPEVCGGVGQRMLGNDELITPEVTLK